MATLHPGSTSAVSSVSPPVVMLSGHIDITKEQFQTHYIPALDKAISSDHSFIVSNARGTDSMCLSHLLFREVAPGRITVYLHDLPQGSAGGGRTQQLRRSFEKRGLKVVIVRGRHEDRDAQMTAESDYDILWVRSEEETKALYGEKYRKRISGTEKNRLRRAKKDGDAKAAGGVRHS